MQVEFLIISYNIEHFLLTNNSNNKMYRSCVQPWTLEQNITGINYSGSQIGEVEMTWTRTRRREIGCTELKFSRQQK
jgi:hypothetical protein